MKNTLLKIRSRLSDKIDCLASKGPSEKAVYIMTDRIVPEVSDFPAIGLKDGSVAYRLAGGTIAGGAELDADQSVKVTAFVRLLREEDIITGNDNEKGILDLAGDIKSALLGWNPDPDTGSPFIIEFEGESQVLQGEGSFMVQMKELIFKRFTQVTIEEAV